MQPFMCLCLPVRRILLLAPLNILTFNLQHEVIPNGGLRFALTCRHIDPQTLLNEDERRTAAEKGAFPPGSEQFDYDGSILATAEFPQQNRGIHISNNIKAKLEVGELHLSDVEYILQNLAQYTSTQTSLHNA